MNWNPFRKKDVTESVDPLDVKLSRLKPGYVLDYDLKTWQVSAHHHYDYDGKRSDEWELSASDEVVYLECSEDDGFTFTLTRKIRISELNADIPIFIEENEDPPDEILHKGITYEADSSSVGRFFKNGEGTGDEFIVWDYFDESEKRTLSIEQWSDDRFEASVGEIVEDYQFSRILPGAVTEAR